MDVRAALRQEHGTGMKMFAVLQRLLEKQARGEAGLDSDLAAVLSLLERYLGGCHHGKEEQAVFPALIEHGLPEAPAMAAELAEEHHQAGDLLQRMRSALSCSGRSSGISAAAEPGQAYLRIMRGHIRKENARLLPLCQEHLQGEVGRAVLERMEAAEAELLGPGEKERLLSSLDALSAKHR